MLAMQAGRILQEKLDKKNKESWKSQAWPHFCLAQAGCCVRLHRLALPALCV